MNATELNRILADEINKVRSGKSKPERTNSVVRAANAMIANARLQLTYMKVAGPNASAAALPYFGANGNGKVINGTAKALPAKKKK